MLSNVEELRKMEIAEEIGRIKKRRVEMSEVIKIYNDIKNGMIKKEEESRFYNFYQNKVEIEQIVRELDQQQVRLNNIKEIRDEINVIKQTIVYYLKEARLSKKGQTLEQKLEKQISKLNTSLTKDNIIR